MRFWIWANLCFLWSVHRARQSSNWNIQREHSGSRWVQITDFQIWQRLDLPQRSASCYHHMLMFNRNICTLCSPILNVQQRRMSKKISPWGAAWARTTITCSGVTFTKCPSSIIVRFPICHDTCFQIQKQVVGEPDYSSIWSQYFALITDHWSGSQPISQRATLLTRSLCRSESDRPAWLGNDAVLQCNML